MPDAELAVKIGDEWVPLDGIVWLFQYACGCPYGVTNAASGTHVIAATEDHAWIAMYDVRSERMKARRAGETCTPMTLERYRAEFRDRMSGSASHTCEFGPVDRSGEIPGQLDLIDELAKVSV